MPVYEYRCDDCGHQFEVEQRMSDSPLKKCETCGGKVQRLLFAPAIHFKGTGFHNTDYGTRKRPKDGDKSDSGTSTTSADGASSSSGSDTSTGTGGATKAKEATPAARAKRGVGP